MASLEQLTDLLDKIDVLLESYDPGEMLPDKLVGDLFAERAQQRPVLEQAAQLATEGLVQYPFNSELLRRRAFALAHIVTPQGEFPELAAAEDDWRTILIVDPNNLRAAFEYAELMFSHSGMEDSQVAEVVGDFATKAETVLTALGGLQIKAWGHAGEYAKAEEIYQHWHARFPDSSLLEEAIKEVEFIKELDEETAEMPSDTNQNLD